MDLIIRACTLAAAVCCLVILCGQCRAEPNNKHTDWLKDAHFGLFMMHFLPGDAKSLALAMGLKYGIGAGRDGDRTLNSCGPLSKITVRFSLPMAWYCAGSGG